MYKIFTSLAVVAMLNCGCSSGVSYTADDNSVTVQLDSLTTEITIVDSQIIRVRKYPLGAEPKQMENMVTILEPQNVDWSVGKSSGNVVIKTPALELTVDKNGDINYNSVEGKNYTKELSHNRYIKADESALHMVSQAFEAGDDEALYGLGQFQSGRMNWRNASIRLLQSNQEAANPVLVSTKGYGIFWNNYGVTDFNYPDNELQSTKMIDKEQNIKGYKFTPKKSGVHNFMVISETPGKNKQFGAVVLTVGADTVIHYKTMWHPDSFSGDVSLEAGKEYDVVLQDTGAMVDENHLLYNEPDYGQSQFSSQTGEAIDYYFVGGGDPKGVIAEYSRLTGTAPMLSKAAYGFWQCREAYHNQKELLESARGYRARKIPVDYIVQDWDYWPTGKKGPHWDRSRYPNPKAMVDELKDMNYRFMVSVWPQVLDRENLKKYGLDKEILGAGYVDFYKKDNHAKYYQMLSDSMFHIGVNSIWLDGSEPASTIDPERDTQMGKYKEVANIYSLLVTKSMYEGRRKEFPRERVVNLTRSAFAGQQKHGAVVWSGDVDGSFEQFGEQIAAGLNFTMTGLPYWTTDIGGFFRDSKSGYKVVEDQFKSPVSRELLNRWFQFGTFCPVFRIHGFRTETEIWKYDDNYEAMARKFIDIRYHLLPYIYSLAYETNKSGAPIMSPVVYQYPEDRNTWSIKDQFFMGESIMACPVTEHGAREREVYLPKGEWYDFWSGDKIEGGKSIKAAAPLNIMPIYIKAGSIIPWGPKLQYATEATTELTTIKIYPGADGSFKLYYDDNESYDYESGKYTELELKYSDSDRKLTIECLKDGYLDIKKPLKFKIEVVGEQAKQSEILFKGEKLEVNL